MTAMMMMMMMMMIILVMTMMIMMVEKYQNLNRELIQICGGCAYCHRRTGYMHCRKRLKRD